MENKDKQRLIVTGGAGFIGRNFIGLILESREYYLINIDNLSSGVYDSIKDLEKDSDYEFINADIADKEKMLEIIKEGDIIVNFAAESHVDNSIKDPSKVVLNNIAGTLALLEAARQKGVKKFVQISTDEVYGSLDFNAPSSKEEDNIFSRNPYSASKAACEQIALSYHNTFGLPVVVTRSSNNFGAYQFPEKVIPLFATNLIEGRKVPLYGEGKNVRDWLFVKDNCKAIEVVMNKGEVGKIYNIGAGNEISNLELTKKILGEMRFIGEDAEKMIERVEDRKGHDLRYSLDIEKIKSLGWKPEKSFIEALRETIEWYKNNEEWWKPLKDLKDRRTRGI